MIGLLPINSAPVNGTGAGGVLHTVSAGASASAALVSAEPSRVRRAKGVASAQADGLPVDLSAERLMSAFAKTSGTVRLASANRWRETAGTAAAVAAKVQARLQSFREIGAIYALARSFAAPAGTLINASYYVIAARAQCLAAGIAQLQVIKRAKGYFYNPASATNLKASLMARRTSRVSTTATAVANGLLVRNRVFSAAVLASANASILGTVLKIISGAGIAVANSVRATIAFIQVFAYRRFYARATAAPPQMVTWMYANEPDYRTVFVRNDASTTRMRTFRKQPEEVLPYDVDFAEWLAPLHGDDIESAQAYVDSAVSGDPADLIIDRVFIIIKNPQATMDIEPVRVKVWLSGGIHGATYKITVRVDTEGGRRKEVDFRLTVREV